MGTNVFGVFRTPSGASSAVEELRAVGISKEDVSVLMSAEGQGEHFQIEERSRYAEGAAAGGAIGGAAGAIIAGMTAAAAVAVPGIGVLAAGPIVAALAGGGVGAAAGGLIGTLVGTGLKTHEAKLYEDEVKRGNILLGVHTESSDEAERVVDVMRRMGALNFG